MEKSILSADQIMKQIALELRSAGNNGEVKSAKDFWKDCLFELRIAITTDIYETEYDFTQRYGVGHSFNYSLSCYEEGRQLAQQIYCKATGINVDMAAYTGDQFRRSDLLCLFIYLRNIEPIAGKAKPVIDKISKLQEYAKPNAFLYLAP